MKHCHCAVVGFFLFNLFSQASNAGQPPLCGTIFKRAIWQEAGLSMAMVPVLGFGFVKMFSDFPNSRSTWESAELLNAASRLNQELGMGHHSDWENERWTVETSDRRRFAKFFRQYVQPRSPGMSQSEVIQFLDSFNVEAAANGNCFSIRSRSPYLSFGGRLGGPPLVNYRDIADGIISWKRVKQPKWRIIAETEQRREAEARARANEERRERQLRNRAIEKGFKISDDWQN